MEKWINSGLFYQGFDNFHNYSDTIQKTPFFCVCVSYTYLSCSGKELWKSFTAGRVLVGQNSGDQFIAILSSYENPFLKMIETLQPFHFHLRWKVWQYERYKQQAWGRVEEAWNGFSGTWIASVASKIPLNAWESSEERPQIQGGPTSHGGLLFSSSTQQTGIGDGLLTWASIGVSLSRCLTSEVLGTNRFGLTGRCWLIERQWSGQAGINWY